MTTQVSLSQSRCKLLVYGYLRTNFDTDNKNCPQDIIRLCFVWYFIEKDKWNPQFKVTRPIVKGEITGNIATFTAKPRILDSFIVFGTTLISKATDIKEWKLKCLSSGHLDMFFFRFGITPDNNGDVDKRNYSKGYDIATSASSNKSINDPLYGLKENDIITLRYISTTKTVTYITPSHGELYCGVNDAPLKKVYDDIAIQDNQVYVLFVRLFVRGESVQLLQ